MNWLNGRAAARLHHHADLVPPTPDSVIAGVSVGFSGEAISIWVSRADHDLAASEQENLDDLPYAAGRRRPVSVAVTVQRPDVEQVISLADINLEYAVAQPLPNGEFVLVNARAEWRPSGPELNATVFNADGQVLRTGCLGDGINHIRTTTSGAIWVGYSDEGVYGNLGWGEPNTPAPMGQAGIVRYSPDLTPAWSFPYEGVPFVDDCYALTLLGEAVWAYYYSGFPIVEIASDNTRTWPTRVMGAKAIVTDGNTVALVGGYRKERDRVAVLSLNDSESVREARLVMPDGSAVPQTAIITSNADQLSVFTRGQWLRVDLADL